MEDNKTIRDFLLSKAGKFAMMGIGYIIIMILIYIGVVTQITPIFLIVIAGCTFFGWKALSRITPDVFVIMPIGKWVTYWIVKGVLSIFVGVFVTPYQISKMIIQKINEQS